MIPIKNVWLMIVLLAPVAWSNGCVSQPDDSRPHNKYITVTGSDTDSLTPEQRNVGSVERYTPQFLITNPTNRTFTNVGVQIDMNPSLTYCHSLSKTVDIPVLHRQEKRIELVSLAGYSNLTCQYSSTYDVVSDP